MNLINEIEQYAAGHRNNDPGPGELMLTCCRLVESELWPRIKAALEAAREMDRAMRSPPDTRIADLFKSASNKFHKAMGE